MDKSSKIGIGISIVAIILSIVAIGMSIYLIYITSSAFTIQNDRIAFTKGITLPTSGPAGSNTGGILFGKNWKIVDEPYNTGQVIVMRDESGGTDITKYDKRYAFYQNVTKDFLS
jgi:hypothetical protein